MKLNPMIVFRKENDENGILFDPDSGEIYELNNTGIIIWEALEQGADQSAIVQKLRELCGDSCPAFLADDVADFLKNMCELGFLQPE